MAERARGEEDRSGCRHKRWTVHASDRLVSCRDCAAPMDPIDVLLAITRRDGYLDTRRAESKRIADRVSFLKGEERRVKARTANAKKKDAEAAVERERERQRTDLRRMRYAIADAVSNLDKAARLAGMEMEPRSRRTTETKEGRTTSWEYEDEVPHAVLLYLRGRAAEGDTDAENLWRTLAKVR